MLRQNESNALTPAQAMGKQIMMLIKSLVHLSRREGFADFGMKMKIVDAASGISKSIWEGG